jgi:gluconolactonase
LVIASAIVAYACSSEDPATPTPDPTPPSEGGPPVDLDGSKPITPDGSIPDSSNPDTFVPPSGNPIEGIAAPVVILNNIYTEGPQWAVDGLYYSEFKPDGFLIKYVPTVAQGLTNPQVVRPVLTAGSSPLGTTLNEKNNKLLTIEVSNGTPGAQLVETETAGIFLTRPGTPLVLTTDAGVAPTFDSPNDVVVRKSDGTIYLTDPSYQAGAGVTTNHLWRIKPVTNEVFEIQLPGRPNGIALSPTSTILYVSFTDPDLLAAPTVMKFPVAADGSIALATATKLADVLPAGDPDVNSVADGIAVDSSGNVYVAVRTGVEVFKPDGTKWGKIPTTGGKVINGIAFGGADKKTLFMTSATGLLSVTVKLAGLVQ